MLLVDRFIPDEECDKNIYSWERVVLNLKELGLLNGPSIEEWNEQANG